MTGKPTVTEVLVKTILKSVAIAILGFVVVTSSVYTINAGTAGILLTWGEADNQHKS